VFSKIKFARFLCAPSTTVRVVASSGMKTIIVTLVAALLIATEARASSILYAVDSVFGNIYTASTTTGQFTQISTVTFPQDNFQHILSDLAADPTHNILYALDEGNGNIVRLDPNTGAYTVVTTMSGGGFIHGLAYDPVSNVFYVSTQSGGHLYRVDPTNGQTTDVGLIGSFSTAQQQYVDGLEFDPTTHFLYGCVSDFNDNGALVSIDTTTGHGTLIGVSSGMTDLAFQPDTNILFGVDNGKGTSDGSLYTVDLATGAATLIGHTGNHSALGLAFLSVPEPSTFALAAMGLAGVAVFARRHRK
jgi:DNA-binding beta-propeller fold protein YncE